MLIRLNLQMTFFKRNHTCLYTLSIGCWKQYRQCFFFLYCSCYCTLLPNIRFNIQIKKNNRQTVAEITTNVKTKAHQYKKTVIIIDSAVFTVWSSIVSKAICLVD